MSINFPIRWIFLFGLFISSCNIAYAELADTIAKVKPSILIVGYYKSTNSPRFTLRGSGFVAVGGNLAITNSHVLFGPSEDSSGYDLVVQVRGPKGELQMRQAVVLEQDRLHDLALLRFAGEPVPSLALRDSNTVREGQSVALMGFPIGGALGFSPVTHRAMVSSITPIVLPAASGQLLTEKSIRSIRDGSFDIFQLDGTAYPGNSGGPLFDVESGEVVGIVNMVFVKGTKESAISLPSGISYAIPANYIQQLVQRQKAN
nr:serine protease [uncultured Albidiferax sp.]